jgi:hypothetical protein
MNTLILYLEQLTGEHTISKDGIHFHDVAIVKMMIDGSDFDEFSPFKDSLVFFDELEKSKESSGNYLIFTCACGIAEDGGWEGVQVTLQDSTVNWKIDVGEGIIEYTFARSEYDIEIKSVKDMLQKNSFPVEPTAVIFPENFQR